MSVIGTYIVGLFPPSTELKQAGMAIMKGREKSDYRDRAISKYVDGLVTLQRGAGVAFYGDGNIYFPDIFRPVARILRGVSLPSEGMEGMSPVPRKNRYYLRPIIDGEIVCEYPSKISSSVCSGSLPRPIKVALPGIFSFVRASDNRHYTDQRKAMEDYVRALERIALHLSESVDMIELDESLLVFENERCPVDREIMEAERRGLENVRKVLDGKARLAVNLGYGDSSGILRFTTADIYAVNTIETDPEQLEIPDGGVALGVVDNLLPSRTHVEDVDDIAEAARLFIEEADIGGREIYLVSNAQLIDLPFDVANQKMLNLGGAVGKLKSEYNE